MIYDYDKGIRDQENCNIKRFMGFASIASEFN